MELHSTDAGEMTDFINISWKQLVSFKYELHRYNTNDVDPLEIDPPRLIPTLTKLALI